MTLSEIPWGEQSHFPLLSLLVVVPLCAALAAVLLKSPRRAAAAGFVGAVAELVIFLLLWLLFDGESAALQFVESIEVTSFWSYRLGVDGIGLLFIGSTALICLLLMVYGVVESKHGSRFVALVLLFEATSMGMYTALDLLLFWCFAVVELIPVGLLLMRWGTAESVRGVTGRYLQFATVGVLLILAGILALGWQHAAAHEGEWSFRFDRLASTPLPENVQSVIFCLLFYGFAVRMPLFPFHAWFPVIAGEGTVASAAVLLAGMKLSVYAMLRFLLPLLPDAAAEWGRAIMVLGLIGVFYGAVLAFLQINLRRLLAFAVVSHTGMLMIGLFCLNRPGLEGSILLAINFGIATATMLFVTGFVYRRTGSALLPRLGGLFDPLPVLGLTFLIAALSTMAMPGTPGFDAAHLLLEGVIERFGWGVAIATASGNVLAAGFLLWAFQRAFLAQPQRNALRAADNPSRNAEMLLGGVLCTVLLVSGFYSQPWHEIIQPSVGQIGEPFEHRAQSHRLPETADLEPAFLR